MFHNLQEPHNHHHCMVIGLEGNICDAIVSESEDKVFYTNACECLLCQQYKVAKLFITNTTKLELKNLGIKCYVTINYKDSLFSTYLLNNSSLRAPPTSITTV